MNAAPDIRPSDWASIALLYREVFGETLTRKRVADKERKGPLSWFTVHDNDGNATGFCTIQHREASCHVWLLGVAPGRQGKGYGRALLTFAEQHAVQYGFSTLTISTYPKWTRMVAMLSRLGFKATGDRPKTPDGKMRLEKRLHRLRELRVLITARCNYRCIFCHREGVRVDNKPDPSPAALLETCRSAMALGYNDITLSGGEPFLRKDTLRYLLKGLSASRTPLPAVTLVTNGTWLDRRIIADLAAYPGQLKMNISLHAVNPDAFRRITKTRTKPGNVLAHVRQATGAGIKVKLNSVILKGINHTSNDLMALIKTGRDTGVSSIKFLELLVEQDHPELYPLFYSEEAVRRDLADAGFLPALTMPRRTIMRNPSWPGLDVEVQKCVCKFGCESCARLRDMTIGQDLRYYPCFVHSCEGIPFHGPDQMQRALARGKQRFAAYARKYGRNSPTLIRQDEYLKERWEVFFEIPALFEKCEKLLMRQGFHRGQIRAFTLHYCRPRRPSAEWTQFRRVLKFGSDEHTPNKVEFIDSEHEYRRQGPYLLNLQRFKEAAQPPSCKAERTPQKQIAKKGLKGFEIYMTRRFEVHDFEKGAIKLCLDKAGGKVNLKISLKNLNEPLIRNALRDLGARPIRIPFTKWSLYNASQTQ